MNRFLSDAQQILEAAETGTEGNVAILIHGRRGIRVMTGKTDWPLHSLLADSGATAAYRVSRQDGRVLVEGQSGTESCVLERKGKGHVVRELFAERRSYELVDSVQCGSEARMLLT